MNDKELDRQQTLQMLDDYAIDCLGHMRKLEDSIGLMNTDVQDAFYEALYALENIEKELHAEGNTGKPSPNEIIEERIADKTDDYDHNDNYLLYVIGVQLAFLYNDAIPASGSDRLEIICAIARKILANNGASAIRYACRSDIGKSILERHIAVHLSWANIGTNNFVDHIQGIENASFQWLLLDLKERSE